ncbi:MAG: hypothetical protein LQ339_004526 [Xanthoria mediterranea]|nr:MAG: hypothetical protein LQ339_004526 [Xanthoria mediterranea]
MTQELVLITGGTGFVGYACVVRALDQSYRVRLAVRSESSIEIIKNAPSCQPRLDSIEFVAVNDITREGAFNEAMQDVSYVIHVASPTPRPDMVGIITEEAFYCMDDVWLGAEFGRLGLSATLLSSRQWLALSTSYKLPLEFPA